MPSRCSTFSRRRARAMSVPPAVAHSRAELAVLRAALQGEVAVVMTMGALHEGHGQLIRAARARGDSVVVTIFLNPLQFAAAGGLGRLPLRINSDLPARPGRAGGLPVPPAPGVHLPG